MRDKPYILAVDPGNVQSAFCLVSPDLRPLAFEKCRNRMSKEEQKELIESTGNPDVSREIFFEAFKAAIAHETPVGANIHFVIEDIENFGMPAGRSLFDTEKYIGRLSRLIEEEYGDEPEYIFRHEEKMTICRNPRANDATIKQALVDMFAPGVPNHGKGTKKEPGFFYGMKADCWSAFAIAVTYHDKYLSDDLHLADLPF